MKDNDLSNFIDLFIQSHFGDAVEGFKRDARADILRKDPTCLQPVDDSGKKKNTWPKNNFQI